MRPRPGNFDRVSIFKHGLERIGGNEQRRYAGRLAVCNDGTGAHGRLERGRRRRGHDVRFSLLEFDQFPHPTFKGESAEALRAVRRPPAPIFQQGDDFDFLANGHLFTTPLLYAFSSGQIGVGAIFQQLAAQFSSSAGFGDTPAVTRQALAASSLESSEPERRKSREDACAAPARRATLQGLKKRDETDAIRVG
jgi:hypothetical protein